MYLVEELPDFLTVVDAEPSDRSDSCRCLRHRRAYPEAAAVGGPTAATTPTALAMLLTQNGHNADLDSVDQRSLCPPRALQSA